MRKLEYLVGRGARHRAATRSCRSGASSRTTPAPSPVSPATSASDVSPCRSDWVDWPDPNYDKVGNIQLTRIMGGDIRIDPAGFDIGIRDSWQRGARIGRAGRAASRMPSRPARRTIRSADSVSPTGRARSPRRRPQLGLFFDTSSCAPSPAQATPGMIAGFALEDRDDRRVIGIDASATMDKTIDQVTRIARTRPTAIGVGRDLRADEITRGRRLRGSGLRHPRRADRSTRSTWRRAPKACSPTRSTRASRWPA